MKELKATEALQYAINLEILHGAKDSNIAIIKYQEALAELKELEQLFGISEQLEQSKSCEKCEFIVHNVSIAIKAKDDEINRLNTVLIEKGMKIAEMSFRFDDYKTQVLEDFEKWEDEVRAKDQEIAKLKATIEIYQNHA